MSRCRELLLGLFWILSSACGQGDERVIERQHYDLNRSEHVRDLIERKLGPGDDASAIESFFEAQGIEYTYDRFAKRYQAIVRNVSPDAVGDHAIVIYVNVNEEKKYRSYEVYDSLD